MADHGRFYAGMEDKLAGMQALCRSADAACDLRALCQSLNKALNGKGGGNQELCCGKLPDCSEEPLRQAILSFVQQ